MVRVCPICGKKYNEFPAISRKDNKTEICPDCGLKEALESWLKGENKNGEDNKNS